jgi:hypothetical protein
MPRNHLPEFGVLFLPSLRLEPVWVKGQRDREVEEREWRERPHWLHLWYMRHMPHMTGKGVV